MDIQIDYFTNLVGNRLVANYGPEVLEYLDREMKGKQHPTYQCIGDVAAVLQIVEFTSKCIKLLFKSDNISTTDEIFIEMINKNIDDDNLNDKVKVRVIENILSVRRQLKSNV